MKRPHGTCILSAKSFYFGVGGGIAEFKGLVKKDNELKCETVKVFDDGQSNRREILKLGWEST